MSTTSERDLRRRWREDGFIVIRAAGSRRMDLVAMKYRWAVLMEDKASKDGRVQFTRTQEMKEQWEELVETRRHTQFPLYVAHYLKYAGNRGHSDPRRYHPIHPDAGMDDYPVLHWEDGLKHKEVLEQVRKGMREQA